MGVLDQMRAKAAAPSQEQAKSSSGPMEAMLLKMLAGVGLDAGALQKVQADIAGFANWIKESLTAIHGQNVETKTTLADIVSRLERIENANATSQQRGEDHAQH